MAAKKRSWLLAQPLQGLSALAPSFCQVTDADAVGRHDRDLDAVYQRIGHHADDKQNDQQGEIIGDERDGFLAGKVRGRLKRPEDSHA